MSTYPNVTEQDLINLSNLAEQQKNRIAIESKKKLKAKSWLKKLAETLSPLTKQLKEIFFWKIKKSICKEHTQSTGFRKYSQWNFFQTTYTNYSHWYKCRYNIWYIFRKHTIKYEE